MSCPCLLPGSPLRFDLSECSPSLPRTLNLNNSLSPALVHPHPQEFRKNVELAFMSKRLTVLRIVTEPNPFDSFSLLKVLSSFNGMRTSADTGGSGVNSPKFATKAERNSF